mgnify:CR=1 FL=1
MKKSLLTAALLLTGMTVSLAQPDASNWKEGDEITGQVSWGNLSFENDPMDFWKFTSTKGSTTQTGGLFEVYDGADADLYQYVQLPAGMYRLECQAYYRCGTSWDDDPNSYGDPDRWADNALLYVSNGTYDITSDEFTAGRTFKCPLMPRLFDYQDTQLYVGPKDGEEGYPGWDMSDGDYGLKGWGPCSVPGSLVWFNAGKYQPYEDEDVKYNKVTFFLTEDGYVRLGVKKTEPRSADSFMATNFKMFYMGEAGEAAELMALQDEVADHYHALEDMENKCEGMLYTLISDARMEFEGEYGDIESMTKEECLVAIQVIKEIHDQAVAAQAACAQLEGIIQVMQILYNTTDYAGKDAFGTALQQAQNCIDPNYEPTADDNFGTFQVAYDELCAARIAYLMTQEPENGAYNFSSAINNAFFCDNEYTPMWNVDANAYQFPTLEGIDESLQPENTWATIQEQSYTEAKADESRADWTPICETVKIYEKAVENQWVIHSTTWHGGAIGVTMQHGYPAIGGWTASPSGNPELLYQTITGLPNGYYAMSALMCNAGADISDLQFAYIEAGSTKEVAHLTQKGNPWWGGNRDQWRQTVWQKLTTNMVYVGDGQVTIGTSSDAFYASTGFQLYYYGENPDFTALVAPSVAAAQANIENLTWPGDKAAANAILAKIPATIEGQDSYMAALATIAEANDYVSTATNVINNWKALDNFSALNEKQAPNSPEYSIVETAFMRTLTLGEGDEDTYLDAIASDNDYAAYADYLDYRSSMGELISTDADLVKLVAEQNAYLTENYATAAELIDYKAQLAAPYNKALLVSLGYDKATPENPVDITALIVNPNFDEGSKGWTGSITLTSDQTTFPEELGTAEVWNTNFTVSQTIYALPAGLYRVEAQAFYRDGGDASTAYNNWWYTAGGEFEFWENPNAKLFANNSTETIVSIASVLPTEQSMTAFRDKTVVAEEADEQGNDVYVDHWKAQDSIAAEPYQPYVEVVSDGWYWDTKISDADDVFYYPASLMGVSNFFRKNPTAYINTVSVKVKNGASLQLGIKKDVLVSGDWVTFDNFKLYYLGAAAAITIEDITGLIDDYLNQEVGGTITVNDITNLIDEYLNQTEE